MNKVATAAVIAFIFAFAASPGYTDSRQGVDSAQQQGASQNHRGTGMINNVDINTGKVNISHEAIKSLNWPKMTMDFVVQEKSTLADIKPGMKVNFDIIKTALGYRITRIAPIRD